MSLDIIWHSPAYDPSGYASCARDYILALHKAGVNVKFEPVSFWSPISKPAISGDDYFLLKELENVQVSNSCPHVTHMVPDLYKKRSDNHIPIGYTIFETDGIPQQWLEKMNLMDYIWVPTDFNIDTFSHGGLDITKIRKVPHIVHTDRLDPTKYESLEIPIKKEFYFLTIMDFTHRKGWDILLRAYLREFKNNKDVGLIFKAYYGGVAESQKRALLRKIKTFKDSLKINNAPDIIFYGDILDNNELPKLYKACHCYVGPSRGEGWCTLPDAKIITSNGIKNIIDIDIKKDLSLSHTGNFRKIKKLLIRYYKGELIKIFSTTSDKELRLTPNHKILTASYKKFLIFRIKLNIKWKEAKDITVNDYVAFPKNIIFDNQQIENNQKNEYLWYPVLKVEKENYDGLVYNLSIDKDETYICDFVIVHNCLPLSEAMSMELPTISTKFGGQLEFMNNDNSYLIDVLEMKTIDNEMTKITPNYKGQKWAEPSECHLRQLMRYIYEHYNEAKEKGKIARKFLQDNFSAKIITDKIKSLIQELQ